MFDKSSPEVVRSRPSWWGRLCRRRWGEPIAYAFIFLAGLVFFVIQLGNWAIPQFRMVSEFQPTRGVVLGTRVVETDRGRFRPEVLLEYAAHGRAYTIWTFDDRDYLQQEGLADLRQGGRETEQAAQADLSAFEIGAAIDCWYRDVAPEQAIVRWSTSIWNWFFLALAFSLLVLGLVGLVQSFPLKAVSEERRIALRSRRVGAAMPSLLDNPRKADWPTIPDIRIINESPGTHLAFRLPLGSRPTFPLVGLFVLAVAWNAVAWGVMFHSFLNPADTLSDRIYGAILRSLFCGIGLFLLVWVIHRLLLTFGMGPTLLEISDHPIYPGRRYRVLLHQSGVLRFHALSVDLVCEELARFRQGTDTITNRKDVFRQNLFVRNDFETTADMPLHQEFFLQLPIGAMHSFRQENNEIAWKIDIFAQIAGWPDISRESLIVVRPSAWSDQTQEGVGL